MKKKPSEEYLFDDENNEDNILRESAIQYERQPVKELKGSPPLTEEELKNALTGEEFLDGVLAHIDKLFDKK